MVDQTNKYERNFEQQGQLKRPGRIDLRIFQYLANCGDGYPGLQYAMHKLLGENLFPRFVIEGCVYDGSSTMSSGYIMYSGKVVKVSQQTGLTVNNSEFLYINSNGVATVTAVEATAKAGVMIYARDSGGVGKTIIFSYIDNELYIYNLDVNGESNFRSNVNLNANQIKTVADPTAAQDAVTRTYLRNFMPIGTVLMYKGIGWVDNVSMVGWYKCDGDNGTPDLVNKFIRSEVASGVENGADSYLLDDNQIPTHTSDNQSVNHTHTITVNNDAHTHGSWTLYTNPSHNHTISVNLNHIAACTTPEGSCGGYHGKATTDTTDINHRHQINSDTHNHVASSGVQSVAHTHTYTNESQVVVDNIPVYYSLIFVMRVS